MPASLSASIQLQSSRVAFVKKPTRERPLSLLGPRPAQPEQLLPISGPQTISRVARTRPTSLRVEIPSALPPARPTRPQVPTHRPQPKPSPLTPRNDSQRLPTELWWRILRLATDIGLDSAGMSAFGPPPTEPLSVRRTKRTIVQVCSAWRDMATPFLYEYLAPENHSQAYGLYKLLQRRPQLGKFTRHIAFAVRAPYNDIEAHLFLVAHILLLVPFTQSVHFLFLSGLVPSKAPHILKGPRGQQWGWKSLHWVDTTLNDPRKLERMLNHCPALEELHLAGATVSAASRANTRLLLPQLRMLSVRDADDAVLEMVSGWTMPRLTHLSLALSSRERDERLPRALLQQYGRTLKCLRIDGPGLSDGIITDLIALCPNLEELISRAGIALPHKPMARLRKVGLLRSSAAGSAVLAEHLRVYAILPALRTITVIEDARFALSAEDAARIFTSNYDRLEFVDASGITIALPASADRAQ